MIVSCLPILVICTGIDRNHTDLYLATGMSQRAVGFCYRVSPQAVSVILRETLRSIISSLQDVHMPNPTREIFLANTKEFQDVWQFPNACGAADGKHVRVKAPWRSSSCYFNYKKFFSVILLALVDANYRFVGVDIGAPGSQSDAGVWGYSNLGRSCSKILPFIKQSISGAGDLPVVILGDEGFPLKTWILRPFAGDNHTVPEATFNYRLSRTRRVVENAFGHLAARWRIFHTMIDADNELLNLIILSSTLLHNFLIDIKDTYRVEWDDSDANQISAFTEIDKGGSHSYSQEAKQIRNDFARYFTIEGTVPWQHEHVFRGYERIYDSD